MKKQDAPDIWLPPSVGGALSVFEHLPAHQRVAEYLRMAKKRPDIVNMLYTIGNGFGYQTSNQAAPAANFGTSLVPGQNTFSAYASILAGTEITENCYGILVYVTRVGVSASIKDCLLTIGIDRTGGTTYVDLIPNLLVSCAGAANNANNPILYYFPLYIPSGSQLAGKASVNNATVGTVRCFVRLFGKPRRSDIVKYGTFVRSFGENAAASNGAAVTSGSSGAKGSYVQLGAAMQEQLWWWQVGMGCADTTMNHDTFFADVAVGNATEKLLVVQDEVFTSNTSETICKTLAASDYYQAVPNGLNVYGRLASALASPSAGMSMMAYGLGG